MPTNFIIDKLYCEDGNLKFKFRNGSCPDKFMVKIFHNDMRYMPSFPLYNLIEYDLYTDGNGCYIPLNIFFKKLNCNQSINIIEINAFANNETSLILCDLSNVTIYDSDFYTIQANANRLKNLQIKLFLKEKIITCNEIYISEYNALMDFNTNDYDFKVVVKKRFNINSNAGEVIARIPINSYKIADLPLSIFSMDVLNFSCDFYAELIIEDLNIEYLVPITFKSKELIFKYDKLTIKFYSNIHKNLSSYISTNIKAKSVNLFSNNNTLNIENVNNIVLIDNQLRYNDAHAYTEIEEIFNCKKIGSFTLYENAENSLLKLVTFENIDFIIEKEDRDYIISGNIHEISLRIKKKFKPIKIATWASCFIRLAFRNDINKNWRDYFTIVSHYFQPSLFSITSNPISLIKKEELYLDNNIQKVDREIDKTAFKELSESCADYLLIDFYADVLYCSYKLHDNTFIGSYLSILDKSSSENINFYLKVVEKYGKPLIFSCDDYFDEWKKHCDIFCEKLTEIGYGKKVILSTGYFNTLFIDNESSIIYNLSNKNINGKLFNRDYITEKMNLWNKMNEYFLGKLPETKVIDINNYNYYADYKNQILGPHHFEKNYYKTFMAELCKQILF